MEEGFIPIHEEPAPRPKLTIRVRASEAERLAEVARESQESRIDVAYKPSHIQTYLSCEIKTKEDIDRLLKEWQQKMLHNESKGMESFRKDAPYEYFRSRVRTNQMFRALLLCKQRYPNISIPRNFF